ncbi:MAG TPA: glycosyltransferase [Solirubrobacteraceae bacterium]
MLSLERPLPPSVPAGSATAIFCTGVCFDSDRSISALELVVDGVRHPASAWGMPRPDVSGSPAGGFWATVPVPAHDGPGEIVVEVAAGFADGAAATAEVGRIAVLEPSQLPRPAASARPAREGGGLIAVCMATFEPDRALLTAQLESLRAQTDERWVCVISDDGSSAARFEQILELVGGDDRFEVSRAPERRGFYRNFERALRMAPADAELIALCDQDDRWDPDKLQTLRAALGDATLVYSDLRLVDRDGQVLRDTLWRGRANNHDDLASMLVANTITGAAVLFHRRLLEVALPFPDTPGFQFHDSWLSVAALASGRVAYVDRPLYDYVQHPGAVFGDVTHGPRRRRAVRPGNPLTRWRAAYFHGYLGRAAQAQVLLMRLAERIDAPKRRTLERFVACDDSPSALAWLAARSARCLLGRTETLGSEFGLAQGVAWKQVAAATARRSTRGPGKLLDASIPPPDRFSQKRLRRWRARV